VHARGIALRGQDVRHPIGHRQELIPCSPVAPRADLAHLVARHQGADLLEQLELEQLVLQMRLPSAFAVRTSARPPSPAPSSPRLAARAGARRYSHPRPRRHHRRGAADRAGRLVDVGAAFQASVAASKSIDLILAVFALDSARPGSARR
jgi:hypothetical protein